MADQAETQSVEERLAARFEEQAAPEETASTPEPEFADIEYAGAKYQIPVALKEAFMKNDDYTRKTQDLAEQRKTYDHLRSTVEQRQLEASFQDSIAAESRDLNVIEAYFAELSKANWAGMSAEQMLKQKIEMDQVKERREQIKASIDEKRSQFHEGLK